MNSRPKKSPSSKARKVGTARCAVRAADQRRNGRTAERARAAQNPPAGERPGTLQRDVPTTLRREFRAWRDSLPTPLERETLLMSDAIAESVVAEASRFLNAESPANFSERLAAEAHYLYPRHQHFHKVLNRPGNRGRDNLYLYMRHWTASWLKRERSSLYKHLPWSYANGKNLPVTPPGMPKNYADAKKLVTGGLHQAVGGQRMRSVVPKSQRDAITQPGVGESARLPWVTRLVIPRPQSGCTTPAMTRCNPVGVEDDFDLFTQGSSWLATLGWMTLPRWGKTNGP